MSYNVKGSACVRCKAYLFEEDNVVVCPVCGAPHHKDCYDALGHCALEELHGTENEYKFEEAKEEKSEQQEPKQNRYNQNDFNSQTFGSGSPFGSNNPFGAKPFVFDFLGGVPADYKLDENVTADDAKKFVLSNTQRYIPKFAAFNKKKKSSWNWLAFLFPSPWMFSRKMYLGGVITGVLDIVATLLSVPLLTKLNTLKLNNFRNIPEMVKGISEALPLISNELIILSAVASLITIATCVITGIFGDYWYKKYTVSQIKKIKAESSDIAESYRKKGGVNFIWFMLAYMALNYIPSFLLMLV